MGHSLQFGSTAAWGARGDEEVQEPAEELEWLEVQEQAARSPVNCPHESCFVRDPDLHVVFFLLRFREMRSPLALRWLEAWCHFWTCRGWLEPCGPLSAIG